MTTDNTPAAAGAQSAPMAPQPPKDFPWMRVPTQRGMKPPVGPDGLRLEDIDIDSYGDVPDVWPYRTDMPRGAFPPSNPGLEASYSLYDKVEVWSDNVRRLYEDAIRDRWSSATDVPWETLQPNPEHIERAICQICTEMSEQAYVHIQVFSTWLERISYGFHEVKNYLATQIYDNARHVEAFRKRALANGGGLGIEGPGIYHRALASALKFTELVIAANIVRATFNLVVVETLRGLATSDAERTLYSLVERDLHRHIAYGVGHLTFYVQRQPHKVDQLHVWLSRAEQLLVADQQRDTPFNEALIILLGRNAEEGRAKLDEARRTWLAYYLNRLADARIYDRVARLVPDLKRFAPEDAAVPNTVLMRPPVADPAL
jgi:hypothetical protein